MPAAPDIPIITTQPTDIIPDPILLPSPVAPTQQPSNALAEVYSGNAAGHGVIQTSSAPAIQQLYNVTPIQQQSSHVSPNNVLIQPSVQAPPSGPREQQQPNASPAYQSASVTVVADLMPPAPTAPAPTPAPAPAANSHAPSAPIAAIRPHIMPVSVNVGLPVPAPILQLPSMLPMPSAPSLPDYSGISLLPLNPPVPLITAANTPRTIYFGL